MLGQAGIVIGTHALLGKRISFKNLGRGYFTDMQVLDCDDQGLLDLAALEAVPPVAAS